AVVAELLAADAADGVDGDGDHGSDPGDEQAVLDGRGAPFSSRVHSLSSRTERGRHSVRRDALAAATDQCSGAGARQAGVAALDVGGRKAGLRTVPACPWSPCPTPAIFGRGGGAANRETVSTCIARSGYRGPGSVDRAPTRLDTGEQSDAHGGDQRLRAVGRAE